MNDDDDDTHFERHITTLSSSFTPSYDTVFLIRCCCCCRRRRCIRPCRLICTAMYSPQLLWTTICTRIVVVLIAKAILRFFSLLCFCVLLLVLPQMICDVETSRTHCIFVFFFNCYGKFSSQLITFDFVAAKSMHTIYTQSRSFFSTLHSQLI